MTAIVRITVVLLALFFSNIPALAQEKTEAKPDFPVLSGPYLGQEPPGVMPAIFAPGVISTESEEFGCSFSPDGTQFYFTRKLFDTVLQQNRMTIMYSELRGGEWSTPEIAPFCRGHGEGEPNFGPSGEFVLYGRLQTLEDGSEDPRVTIVERVNSGWGKPRDLMHGMFASMTSDSIIYYTDISNGYSKGDIYRTPYTPDNILRPERLGGQINSSYQDAHPFVTPSGEILIFDSNRPGGSGDNDLYICFRRGARGWTDPINMGTSVNTEEYDAIPYLTPDGKYFFFFRDGNIYWVDSRIIERLTPDEFK
jgi:hypothetical protein